MSNIIKGITQEGPVTKKEPEVHVPGYGTIPLDMLKRHVQSLSKDFDTLIQQGAFLKAAYRSEQFYNALMALAKALPKPNTKEGYSAGASGGAGLGEEQAPMFTPEDRMVNANDPRSDGWRFYEIEPSGSKKEIDEISNFLALRQKDDEYKKTFGSTPVYKQGDKVKTKFSNNTVNLIGTVIDFDLKTKKVVVKTNDGKMYFVHAQNLEKINQESAIMKGITK